MPLRQPHPPRQSLPPPTSKEKKKVPDELHQCLQRENMIDSLICPTCPASVVKGAASALTISNAAAFADTVVGVEVHALDTVGALLLVQLVVLSFVHGEVNSFSREKSDLFWMRGIVLLHHLLCG